MSDDDTPPEKTYPLAASKMSKTPSWVMLGFVLGALFVYYFFKRPAEPAPAPVPAPVAETAPAEPRTPPPLSRIEAVFEEWGKFATWSDDITEVALWVPETSDYTDCYEVRRIDNVYYFRSIPKLTRRPIERGKPMPECPLKFTETEDQYREWYEHGRTERPIERMWQKPPPPPRAAPTVAPVVPETQRVVPTIEKPKIPLPDGAPRK